MFLCIWGAWNDRIVVSVLALFLPVLGMLPLASHSNSKTVPFVDAMIFMYHKSFNQKENYETNLALILLE